MGEIEGETCLKITLLAESSHRSATIRGQNAPFGMVLATDDR